MIALVAGSVRRSLIEIRRYAFDTFFQVAGLLVLFVLAFKGAQGIGGLRAQQDGTLPNLVDGFIVFGLAVFGLSALANAMMTEATLGTLEQLAMSPFGLTNVLLAEFASSIVLQVFVMVPMAVAAQALTGEWLQLNLPALIPLVGLLMLQVLGISLTVGGLALVFKRVASFSNLVQFALLGLVAIPLASNRWAEALPIALTNDLIRRATVRGIGIADLPRGDLALAAVLSVGYAAAGIAVLRVSDRAARTRGLLGAH